MNEIFKTVQKFMESRQTRVDYAQLKELLGDDADEYVQRYYSYKHKCYKYSKTLKGELLE